MTTVLVVDDEEQIRQIHRDYFVNAGVSVLLAKDRVEAIALYKRYSRVISGIVSDLRLENDDDPNDVSGIGVAREIKKLSPGIPTACVSAFGYEEKIADRVFDYTYRKGSNDNTLSLEDNVAKLVRQFDLYESRRYSKMPQRLRGLQAKYRIGEEDFLTLISALPVSTKSQTALLQIHEFLDGDVSDDDGNLVGIRFVEPESDIGGHYALQRSVPIAVRSSPEGDEIVAELYGIPSVFAYGESEPEAVSGLLDSLTQYHSDLQAEAIGSADQQILRFNRYLKEIFSPS